MRKLMELSSIFRGYFHGNASSLHDEIRYYASDDEISCVDSSGDSLPLDLYWISVFDLKNSLAGPRCPHLQQLVTSALTCFNGPNVEGAFTLMNMTSTENRANLTVPTLSACLTAQYRKKLFGESTSVLLPKSIDPIRTPVNPELLSNMRIAWKIRMEDRRAKKILQEAAALLSERGRQEREKEAAERKRKLSERRQRLIELIPKMKKRRAILQSLPPIPKKRQCTDDVDEEGENDVQNKELSENQSPAKQCVSSRKRQSNITHFFKKK